MLSVVQVFSGGSDSKESASMQDTQVGYKGWEDPLEKEMAIHSIGLSPWSEESGQLQSMGLQSSTLSL